MPSSLFPPIAEKVTEPDLFPASLLSFLQGLPGLSDHSIKELINQFEILTQLLSVWNQKINLISESDLQKIRSRHYVDSLQPLALFPADFPFDQELRIADVGSGAGFPGIPLALTLPKAEVNLIESVQKKIQFHAAVREQLKLHRIHSLSERAEALGQSPGHREAYDRALSRALAKPAVVLELVLPLVRLGGKAFFWGSATDWDTREWLPVCEKLGGHLEAVKQYTLMDSPQVPRTLVAVFKERSTPSSYPRRIGVPQNRPLS